MSVLSVIFVQTIYDGIDSKYQIRSIPDGPLFEVTTAPFSYCDLQESTYTNICLNAGNVIFDSV